jgi:3-hydroxyisobutyrate dehydrogenase-like beta-hydroxyacid dehydrogenase
MKRNLGILHPGAMGISVAVSAQNSGCDVFWASNGRSEQTRLRAGEHSLNDVGSLAALSRTCEVLVSVCPPAAAEAVADQILALKFTGTYLDANAIAPSLSIRIGEKMRAAGVDFVDGGIIGGPAWKPGRTWLYLSGGESKIVAECFAAGLLETTVIGDEIGKASALKMCFAAWTKGTTALLCTILAAAEGYGVWPDLESEWERNWPGFPDESVQRARRVTAKAWRFEGEMYEIAETIRQGGLPGGFYESAAEVYKRMAHFKDQQTQPGLGEVISSLID